MRTLHLFSLCLSLSLSVSLSLSLTHTHTHTHTLTLSSLTVNPHQKRLLEAMAPRTAALTKEEQSRNRHSKPFSFAYGSATHTVPAFLPTLLTIESHAVKVELPHPHSSGKPRRHFNLSLQYQPGFPSFRQLRHTFLLRHAKVSVFNRETDGESIVVTLQTLHEPEKLARQFIKATCFVGYPHLVSLLCVCVCVLIG